MLRISIPLMEGFDSTNNRFVDLKTFEVDLEHSLVSLSKWESEHEIPFLNKADKTSDQTMSYIRYMIMTPDVPPEVLLHLSKENLDAINAYINAKMTATTFSNDGPLRPNREGITAELIYYWMISLNIPFECQHWHLNKLLTLVKVCSRKNSPPKKMNPRDAAAQQRMLNAQRRKQSGSRG
jgi:hypothetical protein